MESRYVLRTLPVRSESDAESGRQALYWLYVQLLVAAANAASDDTKDGHAQHVAGAK